MLRTRPEATGAKVSDFTRVLPRNVYRPVCSGLFYSGAVIGTDYSRKCHGLFHSSLVDGGADIPTTFTVSTVKAEAFGRLRSGSALYEKVPTADLEEEKPGIVDEVALGDL